MHHSLIGRRAVAAAQSLGWVATLDVLPGQSRSAVTLIWYWPPVPGWQYAMTSILEIETTATADIILTHLRALDQRLQADGYDPRQGAFSGVVPAEIAPQDR